MADAENVEGKQRKESIRADRSKGKQTYRQTDRLTAREAEMKDWQLRRQKIGGNLQPVS